MFAIRMPYTLYNIKIFVWLSGKFKVGNLKGVRREDSFLKVDLGITRNVTIYSDQKNRQTPELLQKMKSTKVISQNQL